MPEEVPGRITVFSNAINRYFNPQAYVERPWLAEKVAEVTDSDNRRQLLIVGEPGSGKSAFVAHFATTQNCPRYFIRLDSLQGVSGISARGFLISLGTQLYQKYGPDIFPHATKETEVSAGITKGRAEVVGRFIDRLYTLPFLAERQNDDVRVRSLFARDQARVVGVLIREVHDSTLSLDEETLLEITVLEPLKRLQALHPQERVLMLIDALDEAAQGGGRAITTVIPRPNDADFPPNLRLLMTSRLGDHLVGFSESDRLYLSDYSPASSRTVYAYIQRDVHSYIQKRLTESPLAEAAGKLDPEEYDAFVSEVTKSSGANFLYLNHFFNEAVERVSQGNSLRMIPVPRGLDEIYQFFAVAKIKGDTERQDWKETYLPVLGVLAVLREPVRRELLATLTHMDLSDVEYVVARIKPFLEVVHDGDQDRYGFFHSSFREYLLDPKRNRDWSLDGPKLHGQVADHFRPANLPWSKVNWQEQREDYPYEHLATHLLQAGRKDEVHELVATGDEFIAWAQAHYRRSGSYGDYLQDLDLARNAAAESPACVRLSTQYALIEASIRSLAWKLSLDLLRALGLTEYWSWSTVLANLHQAPDASRASILNDLLPSISINYFDDVIATITLGREGERVAGIRRMSAVWPGPWPKSHAADAVAAADGLRDPAFRAQALAALLCILPEEFRMSTARSALKAAAAASARPGGAAIWHDVLQVLPQEIIGEAVAIAGEIEDEWSRVHVLAEIAGCCDPSTCADDLLSRVRSVKSTWVRIEGLAQVLVRLPSSKWGWLPAYGIIRSYFLRNSYDRARALAQLRPLFGSHTRMIIAMSVRFLSKSVHIPEFRAGLLIDVLEHLPQWQRASCVNEAIGFAATVGDPSHRFALLVNLARKSRGSDNGAGQAAIHAIESFENRADRHRALPALINAVSDELLPSLFDHIKAIDDWLPMEHALAAFTPRLPDRLIADVQSLVLATKDELHRARILAILARSRSQELRRWVFSTAFAIPNPYWRAQAFVGLAPLLPEMLPKLRDAALQIEDDYARANALVPLLARLPASERPALVEHALSAARKIPYENTRGERLAQLVPYVPPTERAALVVEALSWGRTIGDQGARLKELIAFYRSLPASMKSNVTIDLLASLKRVSGPFDHGWSTRSVIAGLTPEVSTEAQRAILAHLRWGEPDPWWYLLYELIDRVGDDLIDDLLQEADRLEAGYAKARVLARLSRRIAPGPRARAIEEAEGYASTCSGQGFEAQILIDLPDDVLRANEFLLWKRLIQSAANTYDEGTWSKLAARVPRSLVAVANAATAHLRSEQRARVLCALARQAEVAAIRPMIEEVLSPLLPRINQHAAQRHLIELAGLVPPEALPQLAEAAAKIGDEYPRARTLIGIARASSPPEQSELAKQAFAAAAGISNDGLRAAALNELAPVLSAELLDPAFDLVEAMHNDQKVLGYSALGARAPSHRRFRAIRVVLQEKAARAIRRKGSAAYIDVNLALAMTGRHQQDYVAQAMLTIGSDAFPWNRGEFYARVIRQWQALESWQDQTSGQHIICEVLRGLRFDARGQMLETLASLAVPIANFGGPEAVRQIFASTESIGRWWR